VWEEKVCAGDPVHAGDKALTRETPAQRGRVNRYANSIGSCQETLHFDIPLICKTVRYLEQSDNFQHAIFYISRFGRFVIDWSRWKYDP
jgi:hypothetical protein